MFAEDEGLSASLEWCYLGSGKVVPRRTQTCSDANV